MEVALFVSERAVRLNLEGINKLAALVRHVEQALIRREANTAGVFDAGINDFLFLPGVGQPDLSGSGVGQVNVPILGDCRGGVFQFRRQPWGSVRLRGLNELGRRLPILAAHQDLHDRLPRLAFGVGAEGRRVIAPEPAQGLGEDGGGVLVVVTAVAPGVVDVVSGEFQGGEHFLVRQEPVAGVDVQIVGAILEENADGFRLGLADQSRIVIAAAQADKSADAAEDAAEGIGPFPGGGKGTDGAAA